MMTAERAVADLRELLLEKAKSKQAFKIKEEAFDRKIQKCFKWLVDLNIDIKDVPKEIGEIEPYMFWKLSEKTDDNAVKAYRDLRDIKKKDASAEAKAVEEDIDSQIQAIADWLLLQFDQRGAITTKTSFGSASRVTKVRAKVVDLKGLVNWAVENGEEDIMESRAKTSVVEAYFEANGTYPPYLDLIRSFGILVRKPVNKGVVEHE